MGTFGYFYSHSISQHHCTLKMPHVQDCLLGPSLGMKELSEFLQLAIIIFLNSLYIWTKQVKDYFWEPETKPHSCYSPPASLIAAFPTTTATTTTTITTTPQTYCAFSHLWAIYNSLCQFSNYHSIYLQELFLFYISKCSMKPPLFSGMTEMNPLLFPLRYNHHLSKH